MEIDPQNPINTEESSGNLNSLLDTNIRTLFYTPTPISPFDEIHSISDGLHTIGRPIEEGFFSPPNRILSLSNSRIHSLFNNTNFQSDRTESREGLVILDPLQGVSNLPLELVLPSITITQLGEEENLETGVRINPRGGTPSGSSSSSSSNPSTPPSPSHQGVVAPVAMAQP